MVKPTTQLLLWLPCKAEIPKHLHRQEKPGLQHLPSPWGRFPIPHRIPVLFIALFFVTPAAAAAKNTSLNLIQTAPNCCSHSRSCSISTPKSFCQILILLGGLIPRWKWSIEQKSPLRKAAGGDRVPQSYSQGLVKHVQSRTSNLGHQVWHLLPQESRNKFLLSKTLLLPALDGSSIVVAQSLPIHSIKSLLENQEQSEPKWCS